MTPDSFLHETRKHYEVFKALFLWSRGHCMKQVLQETKFGRDTLRKLFSNWRKLVLCDSVDKLVGLVESDEMAIGRRNFNRGKRSRSTGVQWLHTMVEVERNEQGGRQAKRLRAFLLDDRTTSSLCGNIRENVEEGSYVQTDGWKAYLDLSRDFVHESVNHKVSFARKEGSHDVHTNTVESCNAQVRRIARELHLFYGQNVRGEKLRDKIGEIVFRFNTHKHKDPFVLILHLLLARFPCTVEKNLCDALENLVL